MQQNRMTAFLVEWVSPFLRDRGFRRQGQRYTAKRDANAIFVRFQHRGEFLTCDIGVSNAVIVAAATEPEPPDHWTIRLGPVAFGYDKWWDLAEGEGEVAADLLPALEKGLEHIEPLSSDEGLRDAWLRAATEGRPGIGPMPARWLVALIRSAGLPDWAVGLPIQVRDGSVIHLQPSQQPIEDSQ